MWPFGRYRLPEDDRRQLRECTERLESLERRFAALSEDVAEFYAKVNKARQRVVKEERDAQASGAGAGQRGAVGVDEVPMTREMQKAVLRARLRNGSHG